MRYLRLKKQKEITDLHRSGKRGYAATLTIVYRPSDNLKMAVCVGKKYGKSVRRNRIKRLLRAAFSQYVPYLSPCAFLLIPRVSEEYSFAAFQRDIGKILERERLLEHIS